MLLHYMLCCSLPVGSSGLMKMLVACDSLCMNWAMLSVSFWVWPREPIMVLRTPRTMPVNNSGLRASAAPVGLGIGLGPEPGAGAVPEGGGGGVKMGWAWKGNEDLLTLTHSNLFNLFKMCPHTYTVRNLINKLQFNLQNDYLKTVNWWNPG